jgi:hypothetical protein
MFAAGPARLDLVAFRELVDAAGADLAEHRREAALDGYVDALGLWRGAAGEGLAHGPSAMLIFAGLNDQFFEACVAAAELAVSLGRPESVLPPLHLAAAIAPLHEPVHASLIATLGAAGLQAEALSVFRTVRTRLAQDLGIDPGQTLEAAHRRVLSQNLTQESAMPSALLGEMLLAAGSTVEASVALDRADFYLDTYGQRYPRVCSCCCGRGCCRRAASPPWSSGPPPKGPALCPQNVRRTCSSVGPKSS